MFFTVFLYGCWFGADTDVWDELVQLRKCGRVFVRTLRNLYIRLASCAILGWGEALLNRPFRWLPWANEAMYLWYMLHDHPDRVLAASAAAWSGAGVAAGAGGHGRRLLVAARIPDPPRAHWVRPCFGPKPLPRVEFPQVSTAGA